MAETAAFAGRGDKPAIIMSPSGEILTYDRLESDTNRFACLLRTSGLLPGDGVAVCLENSSAFLIAAAAAWRSGLTFVPVSSKLTAAEIAFIIRDCGAKALVTSPAIGTAFEALPTLLEGAVALITTGPAHARYTSWPDAYDGLARSPIVAGQTGREMLYSSGTTGRPKGIYYRMPPGENGGLVNSILAASARMGINGNDIYLCPAPLYHSAPYAWCLAMLRLGGTVIVMERFEPAEALALIAQHGVTVSQWVPTHFVRLLKLPENVRSAFRLSSHRLAIHAAAPCPVAVKKAMIDWWGPILLEYFGSSEQALLTMIGSEDWLAHPGSGGRAANGAVHICDEHGEPLPRGEIGLIYSEGGPDFAYHGDPAKTVAARNRFGWTTVGDLGSVDADGYLYIADRKGFMIITGGVNVYPQEIESLLVTHPRVADAAVIGLNDPDLGERVTAVVKPIDMAEASEGFAEELRAWMRESLSGVKCPKLILFRSDLPRLPTGKMVKHELRDRIERELARYHPDDPI